MSERVVSRGFWEQQTPAGLVRRYWAALAPEVRLGLLWELCGGLTAGQRQQLLALLQEACEDEDGR
jgi:hypothetical protein